MQHSAGTLLYRSSDEGPEVLIVHHSGNFNRHAPWSIPKGLLQPGESLELAARRETWEETGIEPGALWLLGDVVYQTGRKRVTCFAGEADPDAEPRCASWEVDAAEFVPAAEARRRLHRDQVPLLELLEARLAADGMPTRAPGQRIQEDRGRASETT